MTDEAQEADRLLGDGKQLGFWGSIKATTQRFVKSKFYPPVREVLTYASLGALFGPLTLAEIFNHTQMVAIPYSTWTLVGMALAEGVVLRVGYQAIEAGVKGCYRHFRGNTSSSSQLDIAADIKKEVYRKCGEVAAIAAGSTAVMTTTLFAAKEVGTTLGQVAFAKYSDQPEGVYVDQYQHKMMLVAGLIAATGDFGFVATHFAKQVLEKMTADDLEPLSVNAGNTGQQNLPSPHSPGEDPARLKLSHSSLPTA